MDKEKALQGIETLIQDGNNVLATKYNSDLGGSVVPIRISEDWKHIGYAANTNGFINVCHFSDTFLIYVNYCLRKPGFWLADIMKTLSEEIHLILSWLMLCQMIHKNVSL